MVRAGHTIVVTGYPGPVARHAIDALAGGGDELVLVTDPSHLASARALCASLTGARAVRGDAARVDLGLPGAEASRIGSRLSALMHLEEPAADPDRRRALRCAREIVEFASLAGGARVVALCAPGPGQCDPCDPGALERVLGGRGSGLGATLVRTGVPAGTLPPWSAAGSGRLLHLIVLLHLSVDIRRLRRVSSRKLVLTSASFAADVVVRAATGDLAGDIDLTDPRPPSLAEVDRAMAGMLEAVAGVDAEFLASCRRHRDRVMERWIGHADPVEVLSSWTVPESLGGGGERVARDLGLAWQPTLAVLEACLGPVVRDVRADLGEEAEVRDALLG